MTDSRLRELRRLVRSGEVPADLIEELRSAARGLVRRRALPPSFAPYGRWDDEAADEVFAGWYAYRLLGRGQLQALLDGASTVGGLRRLAERSLRQYLINARDRSQAGNLYRRLVALLEDGARFRLVLNANRAQDRWYAVRDAPGDMRPWAGDERSLLAHGWALGDFVVIRYKAGAAKLSPVLDAGELERFVDGLLGRVHGALTAALIMRVLSVRFDLGEVELEPGDEVEFEAHAETPEAAVLLDDTARAVLAGLTARQRAILTRSGSEGVAAIALELGCAAGTVINEQRRIADVVTRLTEDPSERDRVLNIAVDLVYEEDDG